uniref:hypothetical protein n=1 Tax=Limnohabitans sp. TaxID=1907725 RepID=UPI0040489429
EERTTFFALVMQAVSSDFGFLVVAHRLILDWVTNKSYVCFCAAQLFIPTSPGKTRYRASLMPARVSLAGSSNSVAIGIRGES